MVLECVPTPVAAEVTAAVEVPTIGIGAGPQCDGQVLVLHDFLGLTAVIAPKFVKDFLAEGGSVAGATRAFADAVRDGSFPTNSTPTPNDPDLQRARRAARGQIAQWKREGCAWRWCRPWATCMAPPFAGDPGPPVR